MEVSKDKKILQQNISTTLTTPTTVVSGSASSTSQPIKLKIEKFNQDQNNELVNFVNSDEFKALAPEEQVKALKEKYMPKASNEQINQAISIAKQANAKITSNKTPETTSPQASESTGKESEIEKAAYSYIEKNKLSNMDIDSLRRHLASKLEKTPEEEKLFSQIQESFAQKDSKTQNKSKNEPLVSYSEMLSDEWNNKAPQEKNVIIANKYFSKTDEKYQNMSDSEKKNYILKQTTELAKSLSTNKYLTTGDMSRVPELLEYLNANGMSIEDYNNLSRPEQKKFYQTSQLNYVKNIKNLVSDDIRKTPEWQNKSADEKLKTYADVFLTQNDPNYSKLSSEEKQKYISTKGNELISKFVPNWDKLDDDSKEYLYSKAMTSIAIMTEKDISPSEFLEYPIDRQLEITKKYQKEKGIEVSPADKALDKTISEYVSKNGKAPTINELSGLIKNDKSIDAKDKKQLLASLGLEKAFNDGKNKQIRIIPDYKDIAAQNNTDIQTVIKNDFINLNSKKPEERQKFLTTMFIRTGGDVELINQIKQQALENGICDEATINNIIKKSQAHQQGMIRAVRNNDGRMYSASMDLGAKINDKKTCSVAAYNVANVLTGESKEIASVNIINNHAQYVNDLTKGINTFDPDPVKTTSAILKRDDVSDSGRALFTQSAVATAPTPERQKAYAQELSKLGNEAVNEGLAAASKSVDKSVRNEYNSYVQDAIKNYPPEKQAAIKTAMQTGEISQSTLSQNAPTSVNSSNSQASNNSKLSSAVEGQSNSKTSSSTQQIGGRTGVSSNTATSNASKSQKTQTKTAPSQNTITQEAKVLQQKKEALINKIASYELDKAEKAVKKEQEKTQNSTSSDKTTNSSVSKSEISQAKAKETAAPTVAGQVELTQEEQSILKAVITDIFQKNSVSAAYSQLIDKIGDKGKDRFMQAFATQGKEADIISFANDYKGNPDTIIKLINYCNNEGLKFDLIKLLPSSRINEMVSSGNLSKDNISKLVKEGKVDNKILMDYLKNNKGSMTYDQIKEYMKYMPLDYRSEILALLKAIPGSPEWEEASHDRMRTAVSSQPEMQDNLPTIEDGLPIGSNKMSMRGQYDKMKRKGPFYLNA